MNYLKFRRLLKKSNNKLNTFVEALTSGKFDLNDYSTVELAKDFLSDSEKLQLISLPIFQSFYDWRKFYIISSLSEESMMQLLSNREFVKGTLQLEDYNTAKLIEGLSSDQDKSTLIDLYDFAEYLKAEIITTFSNSGKIDMLLKENKFMTEHKIEILSTLDVDSFAGFLATHKDFLDKSHILPCEITCKLDEIQQKQLLSKLEQLNLSLREKREILATLSDNVKKDIDTTSFPEEYKIAISMKAGKHKGVISLDLDRNLEDYKGLDNLLYISPEQFTQEQREKFLKLCDICPNLRVISLLESDIGFFSTTNEYKDAEKWINSVISELKPEYSKAQKIAVIDNAIGKKVSYSPNFDTETFNTNDSRALWKIISSGYGVCNGIAKVEQYILR